MQEERSIHDNIIYAYGVDCERRLLVLYTEYLDHEPRELTDVVFCDVVANHFKHVLPGNVVFDIGEEDIAVIVKENEQLLSDSWRYAWPSIEYQGDLDELI